MKFLPLLALPLVLLASSFALAQGQAQALVPPASPQKAPLVSVAPIGTLAVTRGATAPVEIAMQVNRGFHVNSHQPNDELLLPTVVHLDPPEGIVIMNIDYPEAEEISPAFAGNQKLSVYSGSFAVMAEVKATRMASVGTQRVHGEVRYQACDNRQCYPPKTTPLEFDVRVVRAKAKESSPYTAASPHIR